MAEGCAITGIGSYVPERVLANADLEKIVETSDDWITTRTGIKERRMAADGEHTSTMATAAGRIALERAGLDAADLDLVIVATITPDMPFPATACLVQQELGAARAAAFDLEAACTGFLYALEIGRQFVESGTYANVLIIGAEKLSSIIDWKDRNTCVLFGDGAGAAVLQRRAGSRGVLATRLGSDGGKADILAMPGGGCRQPATVDSVNDRFHFLKMEGKEVYKNAVTAMTAAAKEVLERAGVGIEDIKCIIPHQANQRIISAVGDRLGATEGQVFVNLQKYGNTSAASVAVALDEALTAGHIERGDLILIVAFGAGLTWGATVLEW
ncbi:MAG: 3-oxoacyl-ACP synthase [Verrucomicrobiales bacterium]|nr:3-oxoacyl-ACP synthase [Verrucomicrobiales bacterium]MBL68860.1 3-oxoacyl-ACP synthase [Verrucomicrobiales bacterium]